MISEVDIQDWEMLTEPIPLKDVKKFSIFSITGYDGLLMHTGKIPSGASAILLNTQDSITYHLPDFFKVNLWLKK